MFFLATAARTTDIKPGERMVTTVVYVKATSGLLWLTAPDGSLLKIEAPAHLLDELRAADTVEVSIVRPSEADAVRMPPSQTVSAVVQIADADTGMLRLKTVQGAIIDVQPAREFLDHLRQGERVQVAIYKLPSAP
jgi:hypothetical protein